MNNGLSVFISHSTLDKSFVERLKPFLESIGVTTFVDNYEIVGGDEIIERIVDGIYRYDFFCLVLSPRAEKSVWVRRESVMALWRWVQDLKMARSFFIPILREDCIIWEGIRDLLHIDFRLDGEFGTRCDELKNAILKPNTSDFYLKQKAYLPSPLNVLAYKEALRGRLQSNRVSPIPRTLLAQKDRPLTQGWRSLAQTNKLRDLVLKKRLVAVLGDAGFGKSIELKVLAIQLSVPDSVLIPIFSSLNKYVNQSIVEYVPETKQFADEATVLILDGFDEIEAEQKNEAVRQIEFFAEHHPLCRIVLSSRTNLYQQVSGFERFYLADLTNDDIERYLAEKLGRKARRFREEAWKKNYHVLTTHPFYLNLMIETFTKSGSLPQRKADLFEFFVQSQLEEDLEKFRTAIPDILDRKQSLSHSMERLALIMENLGRNFITEEELTAIVPDPTERRITWDLGLLRKIEGEKVTLQFQHNSFQEFLAAKVLASKPLTIFKEFVAFAPEYLKTKPSWVNTISFVLSLSVEDSGSFNEIVTWLSQIEPEVLFKGEPDRISTVMRFAIFKKIFEEYREKRIRIGRETYSVKDIGQFADSTQSIEYLLSVLEAEKDSTILDNAVDVLRFMNIPPSQRNKTENLLLAVSTSENSEPYLISSVLVTLADRGFVSKHTLDQIIVKLKESDDTWIRFGLYYYLYNSEFLDENVDVLLEGIKCMNDLHSAAWGTEETETRLGDESYHLAEGLKRVKRPEALHKVLEYFAHNPRDLDSVFLSDNIGGLVDNAIASYKQDPTIFQVAADLFNALLQEHQEKESLALLRFFDETATRSDLFDLLYARRSNDKDWYGGVATVLNEMLAEKIAQAYLNGELTEYDVRVLRNFIPWTNERNREWYLDVINRMTDNKFALAPPRNYEAERKARFNRDIQLLFDRDAFVEEARLIYVTEGKDQLTKGELRNVRVDHFDNHYFSDLVIRDLEHFTELTAHSFNEYKEIVLNCDWGHFRGTKLYDYMSNDRNVELTEDQVSILKDWCHESLTKVNFRQAIKRREKGSANANRQAIVLWFFIRKFDVDCPKDVLLDLISFDWIAGHQMAGIRYLEDRLADHEMAGRVVENLSAGIEVDVVLKNHIDYCRRHAIREVIPFAAKAFTSQEIADDVRQVAIETLLTFEEGQVILADLLPSVTDELRWFALDKMKGSHREPCVAIAKQIMNHEEETDGEKMKAAKLLIGLQDLDGLRFFVLRVKETKSALLAYPEESTLRNIASRDAIPLLMDLLEATYMDGFLDNRHFSIHNIIQGALTNITLTNDCFDEVKGRILDLIERKKKDNDDVRFLHVYLIRLEKEVRLNKSMKISLSEAIAQVDEILAP